MSHKYWIVFAAIVAMPILVGVGLWLWVLSSPDPLHNPLATVFPWPIACSTRGCITSTAWHAHTQARVAFAATTQQTPPTSAQTLETLIRHHLSQHALVRSPVTLADVRRYREEILNIKDDKSVVQVTGLNLAAYDTQVILPFLQQEALRQHKKVESATELYEELARDRTIFILPFALAWDKTKAAVTTTSQYAAK